MNIFLRLLNEAVALLMVILRPMRVGVKLLLVRNGQEVLLVKHRYGSDWYLPGGGVKRGESPEQAGRREALEEVGATLDAVRLFGVYSRPRMAHHVVVLLCEAFTLTGETDFEIEAFAFFPMQQLPAETSKATRERVVEFLRQDFVSGLGDW